MPLSQDNSCDAKENEGKKETKVPFSLPKFPQELKQ